MGEISGQALFRLLILAKASFSRISLRFTELAVVLLKQNPRVRIASAMQNDPTGVVLHGGEGETRTRGELPHDGFQDRYLKPLGHLSIKYLNIITD